jgi:hypothetical protein
LGTIITYNGSSTVPTNAGSYQVVGSVNDPNYSGNGTNTLVVGQAAASIILSNLSQPYDGSPKSVTATTQPAGLAFNLTYDGLANAPTNIGSHVVIATITDLNYQGGTTNSLVIYGVWPSIVQAPTNLTVLQGNAAAFSVTALGTAPFSYQWRKDAINISFSTNSSHTISGVTTNDAGNYDVVVSNPYGSVTSSVATLAVVLPPSIVQPPLGQTVLVGSNVQFGVVATGTAPLSYDWQKEGTSLLGMTNAALNLASVTTNDAGQYRVIVQNPYASTTSSVAVLTVNELPVSQIFVASTSGMSGAAITVPVKLNALGSENALGFTLTYDATKLVYQNAQLGASVTSGSLFPNPSFTNAGRLGIAVSQPSGGAFPAGTQEVVRITFQAQPVTNTIPITIGFADVPTGRQLVDASVNILPASYTPGIVTLLPADYEADVFPRPNGDHAVTIADWVQVGRFVAGLDVVSNSSEFSRADCAPRSNLGNGNITVTDWVQAGRYAAGLDPLTVAGGPAIGKTMMARPLEKNPPQPADGDPVRSLEAGTASGFPGQTVTVPITLHAIGDENALGFSLSYDTATLVFSNASPGAATAGGSFNVNALNANSGQVGIVAGLSPGSLFPTGAQEVALLQFRIKAGAIGASPVTLGDAPVVREISDAAAGALPAAYTDGQVTINAPPLLQIGQQAQSVILSWQVTSGSFVLQASDSLTGSSWNTLAAPVNTNGGIATVTVPAIDTQRYYRLLKQD